MPDGLDRDGSVFAATIGRFAAAGLETDGVWLARDKLGINKLFACMHIDRGIVARSYLHELVERGAPFDAIFSVPAGTLAHIDLRCRRVDQRRYFTPNPAVKEPGVQAAVADVRSALLDALALIRDRVGPSVSICLSGGLDSAVVAAHAREVFSSVRAYTYSFDEGDGELSDDFHAAQAVAEHLGMAHTLVTAGPQEIFAAVDDALRYGQDWRDFNVHCAIVNVLLARAIANEDRETTASRPAVLTGDLMNEFLADYTPVAYRGKHYYELPPLPLSRLRRVLVGGLQAGDREAGVFNAFGVDVLQPYGMCCDELLRVPSDALMRGGKRAVMDVVARGLLPAKLLERGKVRAQIGDGQVVRGILPLMVDNGRDSDWLEARFAALFETSPVMLRRFVRGGVYRTVSAVAGSRNREDGYLCV